MNDRLANTPIMPSFELANTPSLAPELFSAKDLDKLSLRTAPNTLATRALETTLHYLRGFVAQPHPHLGRDGAVCPFIKAALDKDLVRFCSYRGELEQSSIMQSMQEMRQIFHQLEPQSGPDMRLRSILMVFPAMPDPDLILIDDAQAALKKAFVKEGLMVGQFHARCPAGGVRNPDFLPLRSPYPMLAIRHMAPQDLVFLGGNAVHFMGYQQCITPDSIPPKLRKDYEEACARFGYAYADLELGIAPSVLQTLQRDEIDYHVLRHKDLPVAINTPADFANATGCELGSIAKSVLFRGKSSGKLALALLPVDRKVDTTQLAAALGDDALELVTPGEAKVLTGHELYGISPLGHSNISIYMDQSLNQYAQIYVGSGRKGQDLCLAPADLISVTAGKVDRFSIQEEA